MGEEVTPLISIIVPQLGRPEGLQRLLDSIKRSVYPQDRIEILIEEGNDTVPNKVANALKRATGEYIVYAANDMEFEPHSLFEAIQDSAMFNKALVVFDTGVRNAEGYICEHFMIRKDFIDNIGGQIFDTDFHHVGVDDLLWKKCDKLGQAIISRARVNHYHFSRIGSGIQPDAIIHKGWANAEKDRELLKIKLKQLEE
jgi:glycosyltransferase involved in cell wall biosynthesis